MISRQLLTEYMLACVQAKVSYGMGCKDPHPGSFPPTYKSIDCSGWVRTALMYASRGSIVLPDGSVNEDDWCAKLPFARSSYEDCAQNDNVLRICFHRPTKDVPVGHVWLVLNRTSYESHSGVGPRTRGYDLPVLGKIVSDVFVLPSKE